MITRDKIMSSPALGLIQDPIEMTAKQWTDLAHRLEKATRICPYISSFQISAALCRSMASVTEAAIVHRAAKRGRRANTNDMPATSDTTDPANTGGHE